jgi:hypothetical protein
VGTRALGKSRGPPILTPQDAERTRAQNPLAGGQQGLRVDVGSVLGSGHLGSPSLQGTE